MGPLTFLFPWLLVALALLPALWWLLKMTPPAAKRIPFPALRLLVGLRAEEETPARTPLWLAILRMILAALIVTALAHPIWGGGLRFTGDGPVILAVDDGYAAAGDWDKRQEAMQEILTAAERAGQPVALLTTAPPVSGEVIAPPEPRPVADARELVQALAPKPWPADRVAAEDALNTALEGEAGGALREAAAVIWISDGLKDEGSEVLAARLAALGPLRVLTAGEPPHVLLEPETEAGRLTARAIRPKGGGLPAEILPLRAKDEHGNVLAEPSLAFPAGETEARARIDLPVEVANRITRLDIVERPGAGSVFLLDESWRRRTVGLVTLQPQESDRPLLGDLYYLKRALVPFSDVHVGTLAAVLKGDPSVLALPDSTALAPDDRKILSDWIEKGGTLVRFAGPHMAESADLAAGTPRNELIPVALRRGGRALGGVMSWTAPMALAPFPDASPFAGLAVPDDVSVERQVLAEPSLDLESKTWAQLADGTPLVTAERRGDGTLVLFHITANADWSNLPLSGLFVEMMKRVVALGHGASAKAGGEPLAPYQSLDGFGRLVSPFPAAIAYNPAEPPALGPKHPPGYYGSDQAKLAVNLGGRIETLAVLSDLPPGTGTGALAPAPEIDLKPWLWLGAFALALADLVISLGLRGLLPRLRPARAAMTVFIAGALSLTAAAAQSEEILTGDEAIVAATAQTRLAYVRTGDNEVDEKSRAGLSGLSRVVAQRTAADLAGPMSVDIESDEILFFPMLYWPVSVAQPPPSPAAVDKINRYLATGGIILFDTGDAKLGAEDRYGAFSWNGPGAANLRRIAENLQIPPLVPLPADHVLTKAYYLMQEFPGRYAGGTLWVAGEEGQANDGVSPVVVGGNDWAGAWALSERARPMYAVVPGGGAQREQAFRFGINMVMYALTGNYKSDQVHVPAILERLGQ